MQQKQSETGRCSGRRILQGRRLRGRHQVSLTLVLSVILVVSDFTTHLQRRTTQTALSVGNTLATFVLPTAFASETDDTGSTEGTCAEGDGECAESGTDASKDATTRSAVWPDGSRNPPTCRLYMARSTIPDAGFGVFLAVPRKRGMSVSFGDVILQVTDVTTLHPQKLKAWKLMLDRYGWPGQETGGQYEARTVTSIIPGVAMLANGHSALPDAPKLSNVIPFRPEVDEADVPRTTSPGAGALTHYHNYTFFVRSETLAAGDEVLLDYSPKWFDGRDSNPDPQRKKKPKTEPTYHRDVALLSKHGLCLDNIRPRRSRIPHAGRGAFSTRFLPEGAIVAPAPVIPIPSREAMNIFKFPPGTANAPRDNVRGMQLLLNYCYGHKDSSLLLFPYAPVVNLINHAPPGVANVRLAVSSQSLVDPIYASFEEVKQAVGLVLEFVALRDIEPDEEILLDYGKDWQSAWDAHVAKWSPPPDAEAYSPAYVMDDVAAVIRTEEEQKTHPYAGKESTATSCFYHYAAHAEHTTVMKKKDGDSSRQQQQQEETTTVRWRAKRGVYDLRYLRPCSILQREKQKDGQMYYTVQIKNRYGLDEDERLPPRGVHVVTHVPRTAIRFTDQLYTTDQHLKGAFRHEIGIPNEIFPLQWMDLLSANRKKTKTDEL